MREIKFRAWDTGHNKIWSAEEMGADELTLNPDGRGFVNVHSVSTRLSHYMTHLIPLQYTGLKDKSGVEAYHNDLVKDPEIGMIFRVDWLEEHGQWILQPTERTSRAYALPIDCIEHFEIFGNIYENPELVKGDSK